MRDIIETDYSTSWQHKVKRNLTATQAYYWCDCVLIIDEENGRRVMDVMDCARFYAQLGEWELTEQPRGHAPLQPHGHKNPLPSDVKDRWDSI